MPSDRITVYRSCVKRGKEQVKKYHENSKRVYPDQHKEQHQDKGYQGGGYRIHFDCIRHMVPEHDRLANVKPPPMDVSLEPVLLQPLHEIRFRLCPQLGLFLIVHLLEHEFAA
jgi:hypothetical protein